MPYRDQLLAESRVRLCEELLHDSLLYARSQSFQIIITDRMTLDRLHFWRAQVP